ncbi:MAG: APC family permease [Candidatus Acidiferrales bacterium]
MTLPRSIGRWAMTGLVLNGIIGSGIFGVPPELIRLLGRASPLSMIVGALAIGTIVASVAEVASQFSEEGGAYLYVRTAFGRFAGLQVGWFSLLSYIGATAANANLFVIYLGSLWPWAGRGWARAAAVVVLIGIPAVVNYVGIRGGTNLSSSLAVAKLLPLAVLIVLGLMHFGSHARLVHASEIASPGLGAWLSAILLLVFAYGGFENPLVTGGEIQDPRRTVPFALAAGIIVCAIAYTLLQYVVVATVGTAATDYSLADAASVLMGHSGASFVAIAVMISTYGWISATVLEGPRYAYAFATEGDFPSFLGRLHPRFNTPAIAIVFFALITCVLALTGTFLWALVLTAGAKMIYYSGMCAALIRLRKMRPRADALRVPFGPVLAVIGILISLVLLTRLQRPQFLMMGATALIGAANWWWAKRRAISAFGN